LRGRTCLLLIGARSPRWSWTRSSSLRIPTKIDKDGSRYYTIRAIPYQDSEMEAARLKAVHEARVKIVPRV